MKKALIGTFLGASLLTACATQTGVVRNTTNTTANYSTSQSFFISGIGQEKHVEAHKICHGEHNVAKVETVQSPKDIVLSVITMGIYTPRTASVYCH